MRLGVEVYISQTGNICLKQDDCIGHEEALVILDPSIVPQVIENLQTALDEYLTEFHGSAREADTEA